MAYFCNINSNMQIPPQFMNPNINFMNYPNINGMINQNLNKNMINPNLYMNNMMNQNFNMMNSNFNMNMMNPNFNMNMMNQNFSMNMLNQNLNFNSSNLNDFNNFNIVGNILFNNNNMNNENINDFNAQMSNIQKNGFSIIFDYEIKQKKITIFTYPEERINDVLNKFRDKIGNKYDKFIFIFNSKNLDPSLTVAESGLGVMAIIKVINTNPLPIGGGGGEINIKFLRNSEEYPNIIRNCELLSLLKLCLLKEISSKLDEEKIKSLPEKIKTIMRILVEGYIKDGNNLKAKIEEVLLKVDGDNIINFSDYVDEIIDLKQLDNITDLLDKNEVLKMNDIRYKLSRFNKFMKLFISEFDKAKKESIFEFSMVSCVIIEREDLKKFQIEREKCGNRVEKILYHGTGIEPTSCILTGLFRIGKCNQHGRGVYFTGSLDNCWFYGGKEDNRANGNKIPPIGDTFTFIVSAVYFNKQKFKRVYDYKYDPQKDEINFAYADANFDTIKEEKPDRRKFVGTEYVIGCMDQICPFMSAALKRNEFCVIWRDINFSPKPQYNNKYDEIFKKFLKERMKYIKQVAKYNVYPCETSEEALKLIERKKYNKIILISNVGIDKAGKDFITNARKIIGSNIIALFLAYNEKHLDWIKNYKNAIFSNEPQFYEEYLHCFDEPSKIKTNINLLKAKVENHYKVKFNFEEDFLNYPNFKDSGKYSDLTFNIPGVKNYKEKLNSTIMEKDEFEMIKSAIEKTMKKDIKDLHKIFQATKDGDSPEKFHNKCDNINNTLILYKSERNRRFGGFASESWNSSNKSCIDKNCFLFSLDKKKIYLPKNDKYYKLSCKEKDGPSFIYEDIYCIRLEENALKNKSLRTTKNETLFGESKYPLSEDSDFNGILAKEYEVLEIIF